MTRFHVLIPARYDAHRLPGKPLREAGGKPLIQWVYERAVQSAAVTVAVATDDARIAAAVAGFGGRAVMTAPAHGSGTDRIAEAAGRLGLADDAVVVNVQGDEPTMPPSLIDQVADCLSASPDAAIATACESIEASDDLFDPSVVKVTMDQHGMALYFSRAPIPWRRAAGDAAPAGRWGWRHIGLYAYRVDYLRQFATRPPCELETTEKLEQLRALWYGDRIALQAAEQPVGPGIDTERDLSLFIESLK